MSITKRCLLGLLSSILVTACATESSNDKLEAENAALREENAQHQQQAAQHQEQLSAEQGRVRRLQGAIGYTVNSDLLFKSGSWQMTKQGKEIISELATKLAPTQEKSLVVNGYTDNKPIGAKLEKEGVMSNQALSEKRAEAVREHLISVGVNPSKVIAVGHGSEKPIGNNNTEKGRSQNRRVELTLGG